MISRDEKGNGQEEELIIGREVGSWWGIGTWLFVVLGGSRLRKQIDGGIGEVILTDH